MYLPFMGVSAGRPLVLGQPVHCLVLDCETDSRVVQVTINPTEVADAIVSTFCR